MARAIILDVNKEYFGPRIIGYSGENNATQIFYTLPSLWCNETYSYSLRLTDDKNGPYRINGSLDKINSRVGFLITKEYTGLKTAKMQLFINSSNDVLVAKSPISIIKFGETIDGETIVPPEVKNDILEKIDELAASIIGKADAETVNTQINSVKSDIDGNIVTPYNINTLNIDKTGKATSLASIKSLEQNLTGKTIYFPPGTYKCNGLTLTNVDDLTIIFNNTKFIYYNSSTDSTDSTGTTVQPTFFKFTNCDNLKIIGGIFDGKHKVSQGLSFINCKNVSVEKSRVENMGNVSSKLAAGIMFIRDCSYFSVRNCQIMGVTAGTIGTDNYIHSIGIGTSSSGTEASKYGIIEGNIITDINGTNSGDTKPDGDGIYLMQKPLTTGNFDGRTYTIISNCIISNCAKRAIKNSTRNTTIVGCQLDIDAWGPAIEAQYGDMTLKDSNIKNKGTSCVTLDWDNGVNYIDNCKLSGLDKTETSTYGNYTGNGIVLNQRLSSNDSYYTDEPCSVIIENCTINNVTSPLRSGYANNMTYEYQDISFKNIQIGHFRAGSAVILDPTMITKVGKLELKDINYNYGTSEEEVQNSNNSYFTLNNSGNTVNLGVGKNALIPNKFIYINNLSDDYNKLFSTYSFNEVDFGEPKAIESLVLEEKSNDLRYVEGKYFSATNPNFSVTIENDTFHIQCDTEATSSTFVYVPIEAIDLTSKTFKYTISNMPIITNNVTVSLVNYNKGVISSSLELALNKDPKTAVISNLTGVAAYLRFKLVANATIDTSCKIVFVDKTKVLKNNIEERLFKLERNVEFYNNFKNTSNSVRLEDLKQTVNDITLQVNNNSISLKGTPSKQTTFYLPVSEGIEVFEEGTDYTAVCQNIINNKIPATINIYLWGQYSTSTNPITYQIIQVPQSGANRLANIDTTSTRPIELKLQVTADGEYDLSFNFSILFQKITQIGDIPKFEPYWKPILEEGNVKYYKSINDTDDTNSILRAIKSCGRAYLPSGTYSVTSIPVTDSCLIYGDGINNTKILAVGGNPDTESACINVKPATGDDLVNFVTIKDLMISGVKTNKYKYYGISLINSNNSIIENVDIRTMPSNGLYIKGGCDEKINNFSSRMNGGHGIEYYGYGCSFSNIQTSQNDLIGFSVNTGGILVNGLKTWGNKGDGLCLNNKTNVGVFNNIETQQNGGSGLAIRSSTCIGNVITGLQSFGNKYNNTTSKSYGVVLGGKNNYIQGTLIPSHSSSDWNSVEDASVKIEDIYATDNKAELLVQRDYRGSYYGATMASNDSNEYSVIKYDIFNPFNQVVVNGKNLIDNSTTACSSLKDNLPIAGAVTVSKETTTEGLKISLTNCTASVATIDDLFSGGETVDKLQFKKFPYRLVATISDDIEHFKEKSNLVLYLQLTARSEQFKKWGMFLGCLYSKTSSNYSWAQEMTLEGIKSTTILGTEFETRRFVVDFGKSAPDLQLYRIQPLIGFVPLTTNEDCSFVIKDFSYKLVEKTEGKINEFS